MRVIIIGGTSGIGRNLALKYSSRGDIVGVSGRREELLKSLKEEAPNKIFTKSFDVTSDNADASFLSLVEMMGGVDLCIYCAGYGVNTREIIPEKELTAVEINVKGFVRIVTTAFNYFKEKGSGHIATISSIAATKGLGIAACYSSSKRFQATYLEALEQVSNTNGFHIRFTTIQPGFIRTDFIHHDYPMVMDLEYAAKKIFKAINGRRRFVVIDLKWKIIVFLWRLIPKWLWVKLKIR